MCIRKYGCVRVANLESASLLRLIQQGGRGYPDGVTNVLIRNGDDESDTPTSMGASLAMEVQHAL
jgi:hypothetical protein